MSEPRFDRYLAAVLERAEREAVDDGSATVEAQHILLAVAAQDGTDAQRVLGEFGLDHGALKNALRREFAQSLGAAGVLLDAYQLLPATPDPERHLQLGASFRTVIERMGGARGKKEEHSCHLLFGILQAEFGTVPRAFTLAGVDRIALIARVRSEL